MRTITLSDLSVPDVYRLISNTIVPRPIAFVSTVSEAGVANLAPFSFFVVGGANPPSLAFSPVLNRDGSEKDTLRNIRANGEYVVNIVTREMAAGMNATSASLPPDHSEWDGSRFTPIASTLVKPARVKESPVQFECRLFTIVEHGRGASSARYIIGEALVAHVADESLALSSVFVEPISRVHGAGYIDLASMERFTLQRPE